MSKLIILLALLAGCGRIAFTAQCVVSAQCKNGRCINGECRNERR